MTLLIAYSGLSDLQGLRHTSLELRCSCCRLELLCSIGALWHLIALLLVPFNFSTTWANADPLELELLTIVRYLFLHMLMLMLNSIRRVVVCWLNDP